VLRPNPCWRTIAPVLWLLAVAIWAPGCDRDGGEAGLVGPNPLRLVETTAASGLPEQGMTSGAVLLDLDRDGDLDILLGRHTVRPQAYRNLGDLHFEPIPGWGSHIDVGDHHATLADDLDGDGLADLYLIAGADRGSGMNANALYLSSDDYRIDRAAEWSIEDPFGRGRGAAALDLDGDGFLELAVLNYRSAPRLFRFAGHGPAVDRAGEVFDLLPADEPAVAAAFARGEPTLEMRTRSRYILQLMPWDLDDDGDIDCLAFGSPPCLILRHIGPGLRPDIPALPQDVYVPSPLSGSWGDFDDDGRADLYLVYGCRDRRPLLAGPRTNRLLLRRGDRFVDATDPVTSLDGSGTHCVAADMDNNGTLDLVVLQAERDTRRTWHTILLNRGDGRFLAPTTGLVSTPGRGMADGVLAADLDGDGDLDLLEMLGAIASDEPGGGVRLYRNDLTSGRSLAVLLRNRGGTSVYGARVTIRAGGRTWRRQFWPAQVGGSAFPLPLHFGIGDVARVEHVSVVWPNGGRTVVTDAGANGQIQLESPRPGSS
jgi:hypothetical protein